MNKDQSGFSILEILIVIIVLGVVGAIGWLVYDRQKDKTADTQISQQQEKQDVPQEETEEKNIPEGWKKYENNEYGFAFYYPSSAELSESEDNNSTTGELNYYSVDVAVDDGDNPALNVYGEGNYKIQTQVTTDKTLSEYMSDLGYDSKIETSNDISQAMRVNEGTGSPAYNTYYISKGKTILAISLIGDIPFTEMTIVDTFAFLN